MSKSWREEFVVYLEEQPERIHSVVTWLFNWFWQHSWGNNCNVPQKPNPGERRRSSCVDAKKKKKKENSLKCWRRAAGWVWLRTQRHAADRRKKLKCDGKWTKLKLTLFYFLFFNHNTCCSSAAVNWTIQRSMKWFKCVPCKPHCQYYQFQDEIWIPGCM